MRTVIAIALAAVFAAASAPAQTAWQLVWSDEFNGPAGSPPDSTKWNYDLGGGGWGNNEAETYTNSQNNVFQDGNGNLVIRAIRRNLRLGGRQVGSSKAAVGGRRRQFDLSG